MNHADAGLLGGILIGGASRRMGACKAALTLPNGKSLAQHIGGCLAVWCEKIVVSAAQVDQLPDAMWPLVIDPISYQGPATGIACLLECAQRHRLAGVFVVSVDLPAITADDLRPLVAAWHDEFLGDTLAPKGRIIVAQFDANRLHPLVAIYPTAYLEPMRALAVSEDRSVRRFIAGLPHRAIPLRPEAGDDVDTPEQWKTFCDNASANDSPRRA